MASETPTDYVLRARQMAEVLLEHARELPDGSLTWGRGAGQDNRPVKDSGPFNGRCGEALVMAALFRATGDPVFAGAARRVLRTLERRLPERAYRAQLGATIEEGLCGLAGILYSLVRVSDLLDEPRFLERAQHLVELFDDERAANDSRFDVIWGAAGVILGLVVLADRGSEQALERAEHWAAHLLSHRQVDSVTGLRAWATLRSIPSTGYAHGACGIAHALLELYRRQQNEAYYEAASEAFAFERQLFVEGSGNWSSESRDARLLNMFSWCHGAPGIALGRLSALDLLRAEDEAAIALDLRAALRSTALAQTPAVDTVCCGYFGRIDVLLEAGRRLGNPSLERQARRLADQRLAQADAEGLSMPPDEDLEPHLIPGFWQGPVGVSYTLLRLADPDGTPCVLAMA